MLAAQEFVDVIVTKDGNEYRGTIIENKINEYMRIELPGGSVFRLVYDDIDVVRKERAETEAADKIEINVTQTQTVEQTTATQPTPAAASPRDPITFHPARTFTAAYYRYDGAEFPLRVFGGYTDLVEQMEVDLSTDSSFDRMAATYRSHVSSHDLLIGVGAGVAIGGSVYWSLASTEEERSRRRTISLAMMVGGLAVEVIGVVLREQGPEHLVNAYNDGRW